jgi:hypothetical protein
MLIVAEEGDVHVDEELGLSTKEMEVSVREIRHVS